MLNGPRTTVNGLLLLLTPKIVKADKIWKITFEMTNKQTKNTKLEFTLLSVYLFDLSNQIFAVINILSIHFWFVLHFLNFINCNAQTIRCLVAVAAAGERKGNCTIY